MNFRSELILFLFLLMLTASCKNQKSEGSEDHINALVSRMTLEEKVAQLQAGSYHKIKTIIDSEGNINKDSLRKIYPNGFGALNLTFSLDPEVYVKIVNEVQDFHKTLDNPVPVIFLGEGLHGLMSNKATVFPQAIGLGCTWDTLLIRRIGEVTALEARSRGIRQLLSPVLDLAREPRFGRIEEMYTEDPFLMGHLALASVKGFQQEKADGSLNVAATLKHYVGHGEPVGGRNVAPVKLSANEVFNSHLLPFERCINEGNPAAVMPAYNELFGLPVHGNPYLLKTVLREKLGFDGLIISDQNAVDELHRTHGVAESFAHAAQMALESGIELDLIGVSGTYGELTGLAQSGDLDEALIDEALKSVLRLKHKLGLFSSDNYVSVDTMWQVTNCKEHKDLAREAAHKSIVLLKNSNNLLPLNSEKIKSIAVVGPNAKGVHFGGYTAEPRSGVDILDGMMAYAGDRFKVNYAEGCKISMEVGAFWTDGGHTPNEPEADRQLIREAVAVAQKSDVVVAVIGEHESFSREAWSETHRGDRSSLELVGMQNDLIRELKKTGKPLIVLLINGRPLDFSEVNEMADAVFEGFYLGQEGGHAFADVLFGEVNPSGKLAVTLPKSAGELPAYYNRKPSRMRSYIHVENDPLYPFGFGLSYAQFDYSKPVLSKEVYGLNDTIQVALNVTNTGAFKGDEIVQLYIRDVFSSVTRPVMELKGFARIGLNPGETKEVTFSLLPEELAFYNQNLEKTIESGEFIIMTGPHSADLDEVRFNLETEKRH
jgi:beta-glucosidase